jgi:hypothetical protein
MVGGTCELSPTIKLCVGGPLLVPLLHGEAFAEGVGIGPTSAG